MKKKILFVAGLGLAVILFLIITGKPEREEKDDRSIHAADTVESTTSDALDNMTPQSIVVEVKGEVNKPGVYEVSPDSRVNELIEKAGGFTEDAAVEEINLAQKAHDEMSILVRKEGDEAPLPAEGAVGSVKEGVIRVNEATQEDLETLNGIGAAKAQAILQYREENGMFQQPEDLLNVSGIGEKTLENFIDQIQIP